VPHDDHTPGSGGTSLSAERLVAQSIGLAALNGVLGGTLDEAQAMHDVAAALAPAFADLCTVVLLEELGGQLRVADRASDVDRRSLVAKPAATPVAPGRAVTAIAGIAGASSLTGASCASATELNAPKPCASWNAPSASTAPHSARRRLALPRSAPGAANSAISSASAPHTSATASRDV